MKHCILAKYRPEVYPRREELLLTPVELEGEYQVRKMNAVIGGQPDEQKRFMMMCTYKMLALPDAGVPEL